MAYIVVAPQVAAGVWDEISNDPGRYDDRFIGLRPRGAEAPEDSRGRPHGDLCEEPGPNPTVLRRISGLRRAIHASEERQRWRPYRVHQDQRPPISRDFQRSRPRRRSTQPHFVLYRERRPDARL